MLLPNLIFETNCCVFLLLLLAVAFGPSLWATFQWCSQQERCGAAASCLHDADAYLTLPLDYNCPIFCRTLICGAGGGATTPGKYFPSKFIITCQGCKTMMQAPKQCRQLTCYKCKAVIAAATYPQLDATRNKSEPDAHKRISCNFPTKMTQVDVLVTQILPPSEFRDYLEQTMVLRTVRPVQRLLLAAMTLRTTKDSSNDQSAVQVRL